MTCQAAGRGICVLGCLVPADNDAVVPPEFVLDDLSDSELDVRRARVPGPRRGGKVTPSLLLPELHDLREIKSNYYNN